MIQTKYDIKVEIDESSFNIKASNATKAQKEELDKSVDESKKSYSQRDKLQRTLDEITEEFEINKHILSNGTVVEKIAVMFEQKALNKKIFKLSAEIESKEESLKSISEAIEGLYKKRFDLLITGADKTTLQKELEDKNISYLELFDYIAKIIVAAKAKK